MSYYPLTCRSLPSGIPPTYHPTCRLLIVMYSHPSYAIDRLRYVEGQLEAERQAHAEARRIIAGLVERIPAIDAPAETPEASETVEEEPERAAPRSATGEAQASVQRRPWWRRVFRG